MLKHPTLDKLHALKLTGMAAALADQYSATINLAGPDKIVDAAY